MQLAGEDTGEDGVMQEAHRWLVLLQDESATPEDRARFETWRGGHPTHGMAWQRATALWSELDNVVPALRQATPLSAIGGNIAPAPASTVFRSAVSNRPRPAAIGRRRLFQVAAGIAAVALGGSYLATHPGLFADYRTALAERRLITLADGSNVELGSNTSLSVTYEPAVRRLTLHDGEAFFAAASDPARPFIVRAGGGEIRALGTAFNVKYQRDRVVVTVIEHAVEITFGNSSVRLGPGEQLSFGNVRLSAPEPADLAAVEAWRRYRMFFNETPLGEAVAEIERYRPGRILVTDAAVAAIPVTGIFRTDQADAALQTIGDTLPVDIVRMTELLILIRPR